MTISKKVKRADMPAVKEPVNVRLMHDGNDQMEQLIPRARGKPLAWNVAVLDTHVGSHIHDTAIQLGAAADQVATSKCIKYRTLERHTSSFLSP